MLNTIFRLVKRNEGFSMIEILIAMGIFAIGSLAIVSMHYSTSGSIRKSDELTQAVYLAEEYLDRTLLTSYSSMGTAVGTFTEGNFNVSVGISPNPPSSTSTTLITVNVGWGSMFSSGNSYTMEYARARTTGI